MALRIVEEGVDALAAYATVPITWRVESLLEVEPRDGGLGGLGLRERRVERPWDKNPDEHNPPASWPLRFPHARWGVLAAYDDVRRAGGAVLAHHSPELFILDGRSDLAVLWDLRVHPELRGRAIGTALLARARAWARGHGCRQLVIESQNVNVRAARFYRGQGCELGSIHRFAYATHPDEVQLCWFIAT